MFLGIVVAFLISQCERRPVPVSAPIQAAINQDSINSVIEGRVQVKADSVIAEKDWRLANLNQKYATLKAQTARLKKKPIPVECDSLIASQDEQIDSLETKVCYLQDIRKQDSVKIESLKRERESKNNVINIAKDLPPPVKQKRLGLGIHAGYGIFGPTVSIGINYTLIPIR